MEPANSSPHTDAANAAVPTAEAALQRLDTAASADFPPLKPQAEREEEERQDMLKRLSRRASRVAAYFDALIDSGVHPDLAHDLVRDWHAQLPVNEFGYLSTAERAIRDLVNVARKP